MRRFNRFAQTLARARKARHHGTNRDREFLGNFPVIEPFQTHQQKHLPMLKTHAGEGAVQVHDGR